MPTPTEPAPAGARRRDALRNEAQIVAAAMHLLAEDPEATMQDVADAAGLGRATVYRHFPTREALTEAIGLAAITEVGAVLAEGRLDQGDPLEALARAIEAIFAVGDRYRVIAHAPPAGKSPEACARADAAFGPMALLIRRAQRAGALAAGPPPDWINAAMGAVIGAAFRQIGAGTIRRADAPRLVMDAILGGFGAPGALRPR